jgi:hypothetical protein
VRRHSDSIGQGMVPAGAGEKVHGKRVTASVAARDDIGEGMVPTEKDRPAGKKHIGLPVNAESRASESEETTRPRRHSSTRLADIDHMTASMTISDPAAEAPIPRGRKFAGTRLHEIDHLTAGMQTEHQPPARISRKLGGRAYESHLSSGLAPPEDARPPSGKKSFGRRPSDVDHLARGPLVPSAEPEQRAGKRHLRSSSESSAQAMRSVGPLPGFDRDESSLTGGMSRRGSFTRPRDSLSMGMVPTAPDRASGKSHTQKPRDNLTTTGFIPGA